MTPDFAQLAAGMPCDEELLPELGRVVWAALRLHHGIRDALGALRGNLSDKPWSDTLGGAVKTLSRSAAHNAPEPHRTALMDWCDQLGGPAVSARDGVVHAIVYGTPHGDALRGSRADRPAHYGHDELVEVAGRLVYASMTLPAGPYA